jgi:hypothetical protein
MIRMLHKAGDNSSFAEGFATSFFVRVCQEPVTLVARAMSVQLVYIDYYSALAFKRAQA